MDVLDEWGEQMSDLIRREDAIKAMAKAVGRILYDAEAVSQHVMNSIPTIEPKRGKWEEREIFHIDEDKPIIDQWQSARCSVCGKYHTTPYMYYFDKYNFCPSCGASMKGEQDDNNL